MNKKHGFVCVISVMLNISCSPQIQNAQTTEVQESIQAALAANENAEIFFYKKGMVHARVPINLAKDEASVVESWLKSCDTVINADRNSYAPETVLVSKDLRVNFLKDITVFNVKMGRDENSPWRQYSRSANPEDKAMKKTLERIAEGTSSD